jgi:hypothetical protein
MCERDAPCGDPARGVPFGNPACRDEPTSSNGWRVCAGYEGALELLTRFPITRYSHEPLLARIWALRADLTAYDAAYVALAEALGATLLTRDERLAAAPGTRATIKLL